MDKTIFEDALRKGLGRVVQHLRANDSADYQGIILTACLEDVRYEGVESSRSEYLYEIVEATGEPGFYRDTLHNHLLTADPGIICDENVELAREFAVRGDCGMRTAIYSTFDRHGVTHEFIGAEQMVKLDGIDGYCHAARSFLQHHQSKDDWLLGHWRRVLEERDGKNGAKEELDLAARDWPELAFALETERTEIEQSISQRKEWQPLPLPSWDEMREALLGNRPRNVGAYGWGRRADDESIRLAAEDVLRETDPKRLMKLLYVFMKRPFPLSPEPLLKIVTCEDEQLAWRAAVVLSDVTHPKVRSLALTLAKSPDRLAAASRLIEANWEEGDGPLVESLLRRSVSLDMTHSIGFSVRDIADKHRVAEMDAPLLLLYENGPCSTCRHGVVKSLLLTDSLPPHIAEECLHDANMSIRELITNGPDCES